MTCWDCTRIIVVPGRVLPEQGVPYSQTHVNEVSCNCGTIYRITTQRMVGQRIIIKDARTDQEKEEDRTWKGQ